MHKIPSTAHLVAPAPALGTFACTSIEARAAPARDMTASSSATSPTLRWSREARASPCLSVRLGANRAWYSEDETGGEAGEACMLSHWCMRALVAFPPPGPTTIVQRPSLCSRCAGSPARVVALIVVDSVFLDKIQSSYLHLFGIRRFLTR